MLDEMENLKELFLETGSFNKWMQDPRISGGVRAEGIAEGVERGIAEGMERGIAEGVERGKTEALREMTLTCLVRRFGEVPEALRDRIQTSDTAECHQLFDLALTATSLSEVTDLPS